MGKTQEYFWLCTLSDETLYSEYAKSYESLSDDIRAKCTLFGLTSTRFGFFFDLTNGEYSYKDQRHQIILPEHGVMSGELPEGQRYNFYQYKAGYHDFDIGLRSSGNIIEKHVIGYTASKCIKDQLCFLDVRLTVVPEAPSTPLLEVTLKASEKGPTIEVYQVNI